MGCSAKNDRRANFQDGKTGRLSFGLVPRTRPVGVPA